MEGAHERAKKGCENQETHEMQDELCVQVAGMPIQTQDLTDLVYIHVNVEEQRKARARAHGRRCPSTRHY